MQRRGVNHNPGHHNRGTAVAAAEAARIARVFPSFRDFVDDALFHPTWGYYSTGKVRFGEGGHYDTFPLALSPMFGRMLAQYAHRFWCRAGRPRRFEICELGAGNGQLCLDVLIWLAERARHEPAWRRFEDAFHYRIVERSPALIRRQREQLGPLSDKVSWTEADLTTDRPAAFGTHGVVLANEVLDCLAHHKIVPRANGEPGVVFVVPLLPARTRRLSLHPVAGFGTQGQGVVRAHLATVLADDGLRRQLSFRELVLPLSVLPALRSFVRRQCRELFQAGRKFKPYFACPEIEPLIRNTARLYRAGEMLWIDYGETRQFHLRASAERRVFAGPPRSGASVYRAPGLDDITFLVDFSVVAAAAKQAGLRVMFYGPQGELARRSGVQLDRRARDLIERYRLLSWMLAVVGVGPERAWRHTGLTWSKRGGKGGRVRDDVNAAVAEFVGKRSSNFKLMILRR